MNINKRILSIIVPAALAGVAAGCVVDEPIDGAGADDVIYDEIDGAEALGAVAPLAAYSADGLQFASPDVAAQWRQEAPGVWRHADGQRLILGAEGYASAIAQIEDDVAALRAAGANPDSFAAAEAQLAKYRRAHSVSGQPLGAGTTCDIGLYTGGSGPVFGFTGAAALAQLSCQGGTVAFTIESQVCTGSSGCGPVVVQNGIADSTPRLWGSVRSGFGSCSAEVTVTPPGITQSSSFTCN